MNPILFRIEKKRNKHCTMFASSANKSENYYVHVCLRGWGAPEHLLWYSCEYINALEAAGLALTGACKGKAAGFGSAYTKKEKKKTKQER